MLRLTLDTNAIVAIEEDRPAATAIQRPDEHWKRRNRTCDVLALWSHIYAGRDVFVTSDANFRKVTELPALIALGAGRIEDLADAHALIANS